MKDSNTGEKQEEVDHDQEQQGQSGGTVDEVNLSLFKKQSFYKVVKQAAHCLEDTEVKKEDDHEKGQDESGQAVEEVIRQLTFS